MIDKITEQKIKDAASIVDVVGEFVTLHRSGVNYEGLCPFHEDRNLGSFVVSPVKNLCNCFACSAGVLDPVGFLMKKEGMSYPDALRWLAGRYGIDCEGAEKYDGVTYEKREPLPPLDLIEIEKHHVTDSMKGREEDTLVKWLRSLKWDSIQRARIDKVLGQYGVGRWTTYNGQVFTCFWQIDEEKRVRSGKLMVYKPNGHRDKEAYPYTDKNGNQRYHSQDFVHSQMKQQYPKDKFAYKSCLFGMHLIDRYPKATINIVESEKTALICSIAYGMSSAIWLATGGKENMRRDKFLPLIERKRHIVLYPDKDGTEEWKQRAKEIGYEHITVNTDLMKHCWIPEDGEKADIADILVRLIGQPYTAEDMRRDYPETIGNLIDKLDLIEDK